MSGKEKNRWIRKQVEKLKRTNLLHFPQLVHVSSDQVEEGKTLKVLSSLVGNLNHLIDGGNLSRFRNFVEVLFQEKYATI